MKKMRYFLEAIFIWLIFLIFKILPPRAASALGGWIGRTICPFLAVSRKAMRHLQTAFPEGTMKENKIIIKQMWDNLGRVIAEYPHLEKLSRDFTKIEGLHNIESLDYKNRAIVYMSGHIGNWEIFAAAGLTQQNIKIDLTYRAPNNPWTRRILDNLRTLGGRLRAYPKARDSGRLILQTLKESRSLGILIDQKYNEGVESLFFGQPAMTNPIFVQLCQKYKCPLIPVRCIRENECNFRFIIYPEIPVFTPDGTPRPVEDVITQAHSLLEAWIKEYPAQWIWLHKRWKS